MMIKDPERVYRQVQRECDMRAHFGFRLRNDLPPGTIFRDVRGVKYLVLENGAHKKVEEPKK